MTLREIQLFNTWRPKGLEGVKQLNFPEGHKLFITNKIHDIRFIMRAIYHWNVFSVFGFFVLWKKICF